MGTSPEVDLDPDALRGVAADLGGVVVAVRELSRYVEPAAGAAASFGCPDVGGRLAAELAGRCAEVTGALARAEQRACALAEELRAGADAVVTADERSARAIRAAEG